MAGKTKHKRRKPIFLPPGGGRSYPMGRIAAIFKADNAETGRAYSVSEWWLEPNTKGPDTRSNDEDHVWYVIEGTMSVLMGKTWIDAPKGSFVLIPGGVMQFRWIRRRHARHLEVVRGKSRRERHLSLNSCVTASSPAPNAATPSSRPLAPSSRNARSSATTTSSASSNATFVSARARTTCPSDHP